MADARYSIPAPLQVERLIDAQLRDHRARLDELGMPTADCRVCDKLAAGMTLTMHQARVIRNRLVQAGLTTMDEPKG